MWIEMTRLDGYAMRVRPEHIACLIDYPGKSGSVTAVYLTGHSESIFVNGSSDEITRAMEMAVESFETTVSKQQSTPATLAKAPRKKTA
jgi:hypothetical protein